MSNVYGSSKSKAQITCRCSLFDIIYFISYLAPIIQSIPIFTHIPMERKIWNSGQVSLPPPRRACCRFFGEEQCCQLSDFGSCLADLGGANGCHFGTYLRYLRWWFPVTSNFLGWVERCWIDQPGRIMRMDGRRLSRMYDVCAFESTFVCVLSPPLEFQARSASMWFQKAGVTGKRLTNRQLFSPWQSHLHIKMAVGQNARRSMSQLFDFFGLPSPKPDEPGWTSGTHWLLPNKHHGFWTSTPDPQLALSGTATGPGS